MLVLALRGTVVHLLWLGRILGMGLRVALRGTVAIIHPYKFVVQDRLFGARGAKKRA